MKQPLALLLAALAVLLTACSSDVADEGVASLETTATTASAADALATAIYAGGDEDMSWFSYFEPYGCLLVGADGSLRVSPTMKRRLVA